MTNTAVLPTETKKSLLVFAGEDLGEQSQEQGKKSEDSRRLRNTLTHLLSVLKSLVKGKRPDTNQAP